MANDFTSDSSCVALWKFESGALTTDDIGSNTLTDVNTVSESSGTLGTTHMEGSCAADFEASNSERFYITDTNLDSGFPFKSGGSVREGSFAFWFKPESVPGAGVYNHIISKWDNPGGAISFNAVLTGSTFNIQQAYGTSGTTNETFNTGKTIVAGTWYHVGFTLSQTSKICTVRLWDSSIAAATTYSTTFSNSIRTVSAQFIIGAAYNSANYYDGIIDEVVVFNRIISEAEIDSIRTGTCPSVGMPYMNFPLPTLVIGTPTPSNFEELVYPISILAMTGRPTVHGNLTNLEYPITFPLPGLAITGAQVGQISSAGFMLPDVVMNAGSKVATMGVPVPALAITAKAAVTSSGACSIPLPELVISTTMGVTGSFAGGVPLGVLDADDGDNFSGSMSLNFPLPSCSITPAQSNAYSLRYARGSTCY